MSEGNGKRPEPKFVLSITVEADDTINVSGPLGDKVLCYGLLGIAPKILEDHWDRSRGGSLLKLANAAEQAALAPKIEG